MKTDSDKDVKQIFRYLPYLLALVGLFMFFYTIFGKDEPPIQSLYWFLLIIAAFFLPYIKEITFHDIKLKLDEGLEKQQEELEKTRQHLQRTIENEFFMASAKIEAVDVEFGEIRDELIAGYQIYLTTLPLREQLKKGSTLTKMYLKELEISVETLKTMLSKGGFYTGTIDNEFTEELVEAIRKFQISQGMVADGVFGHNSFKNLQQIVISM